MLALTHHTVVTPEEDMPSQTILLPEGLKWGKWHGQDVIMLDVEGVPGTIFKPTVWGSVNNALRAAEKHLKDIRRGTIAPAQKIGRLPRAGNVTGVSGVRVTYINERRYWIAEWQEPVDGEDRKRTVRRKFSVEKYGEERARVMAVEARTNRT